MDTSEFMPDPSIGLHAVLNTMVDGLIMIDARGLITLCNPACERIFGYQANELIGKNVKILMPAPDREAHDGYIKNYQRSNAPKIIGIGRELEGLKADGTVFPMYLSVGEAGAGAARHYVGIIRDLTEEAVRKAAFEKLQQEHFHLSRVSAMDQFGSAIAHELNQPLAAIMNYLEAGNALLQRSGQIERPQLENILGRTSEQALRASKILSRLRKFIESGSVEKDHIDLEDTLRGAAALVLPGFKHMHIGCTFQIAPDLPPVLASGVQIQQVLVNLIRNACESMANSEEKSLRITAQKGEGQTVKIGVLDTGPGITKQALEKLYEPFNSTKAGGLGVGLSICRTIIAAHDGKLWAENGPNGGTHFYFSLPVDETKI